MLRANLYDSTFAHDPVGFSVAHQRAKFVEWNKDKHDPNLPTFYSHGEIAHVRTPKETSYGFVFESRSITPSVYSLLEANLDKFNAVFSHHSELIDQYGSVKWIPGGGVWIGGSYGKGEIALHNKSKFCSLVSSTKIMCPLHNYRQRLALELAKSQEVEVFGLDKWVPIYESLHDFKYSIIIENHIDKLYFTEKILNCFATGTIPIYMGATDIGSKFNIDGILTFTNSEELSSILSDLRNNSYGVSFYEDYYEAVKDNFKRVQDYITIEDYIYKNYNEILLHTV